jgi:hypothetical protein
MNTTGTQFVTGCDTKPNMKQKNASLFFDSAPGVAAQASSLQQSIVELGMHAWL